MTAVPAGLDVARPVCSLIVVNYNGRRHLPGCLQSIAEQRYEQGAIEVILVDNGSQDDSLEYVRAAYPAVRIIENDENNFARALNAGVAASRGTFIGFLNNDLTLDPGWLPALVRLLEARPRAGAAGGKIMLKTGRINSAGIRELPDFFWADIGFDEEDRGQYDEAGPVDALCWAAVLFRRTCLENVGPVDEDFVMYCEDVDFAARCRARGWELRYEPDALAHHDYRGSSQGTALTEYFCNRNRLLYLAKHVPKALPNAVTTSHFYLKKQLDVLFECMPIAIKKLVEHHDAGTVEAVLTELGRVLETISGARAVDHLLQRMEVVLGFRKMRLGIYDQALHVIGGGQKYAAAIATLLQEEFDITYVANKPARIADIEAWYRTDLSRCRLTFVPLPFYDAQGLAWIDGGRVNETVRPNPFDAVAEESRTFDVFINSNMLDKVQPLAPLSIFICHFPEQHRGAYFAVDHYTMIINNSEYGREWTRRRWSLESTCVLYPAVDMEAPHVEKEPVILSASRFEMGGSKKQLELVKAFRRLQRAYPDEMRTWRLVLIGGSLDDNPYLDEVVKAARGGPGRIEVRANVSFDEMLSWYARASIFWHACGLNETNPHLVEHFGMTTVEAMQNRCVPIVINGGGQREIVEHDRSGFLFNTLDELCEYTMGLIRDPALRSRFQAAAYERGRTFSRDRFNEKVRTIFGLIRNAYATIQRPDPTEVSRRLS